MSRQVVNRLCLCLLIVLILARLFGDPVKSLGQDVCQGVVIEVKSYPTPVFNEHPVYPNNGSKQTCVVSVTPTPCVAQNYNRATGKTYCYQPQINGVVPIPPAS